FAFGVRLFYLRELGNNPLFDTFPQALDHFNFDQAASNFARGDWLARSVNNSFSPLYKYFLGLLYLVSGRNFYFIYGVQFGMGALASVLVYLIARDLFGKRTGLIAFLGFALYTTEIIYEGILLRAAFITFLGLLSFYLLSRLVDTLNTRNLILATLALSLFFQARPNTLLCLPLAVVFLRQYVFRELGPEERKRCWGTFAGILILSFIPLLVQCYLVHGRFVFFDASGPHTFIAGNLTLYSGVGFEVSVIEEYAQNHELGYASDLRFLISHIAGDWAGFVQLYLRKLYFFLNDFEAPSNLSVYLYREFSALLPWLWNHFALYAALGLVGMVLAVRKREKAFLLYAYTGSLTLAILIFLNEARYRLPVAPYYIIFSAYAVDFILTRLRRKKIREAAAATAAVAILLAAFMAPKNLQSIRQVDYCIMGKAFLDHPRLFDLRKAENRAVQCWNAETKMDVDHTYGKPLLAATYDLYARFLLDNGKLPQAAETLNSSFEVSAFRAYPFKALSAIYQSRGQTDLAIRALLIGAAAEPGDKDLYEILVNLYHKDAQNHFMQLPALARWLALERDETMVSTLRRELKTLKRRFREEIKGVDLSQARARDLYATRQWKLAAPEYARLNRLNGSDDTLFFEQGMVYYNLRRHEEALEAFYSGLLINPGNKHIHRILADYYFSVERSPALALVHLKRYLQQPEATEEYRKNAELFDRLRREYGIRKRSVLIGRLTPKENREIRVLYQKSSPGSLSS
ncbi:MAG: glycosyltransferase family 39 protein, partial [Nitrospinales bacterium]